MRTSKLLIAAALLSLAALPFLATPVSADPTGTRGQPNQSCQSAFPSGPLSPQGFNTDGFANAEEHYAGNGQNTQTSANSNAVSNTTSHATKHRSTRNSNPTLSFWSLTQDYDPNVCGGSDP